MQPSGVRLLQLINTRVLEIAKREFQNTDRLCVYGTGGWWTAFEHSAFALCLLFPDAETFVVNPPGSPFSVVGATVTEKALNRYMKQHPAFRTFSDYLEFISASFDSDAYDSWHDRIVRDYNGIINSGGASSYTA